jgi:hypothetical protein
MKLRTKNLIFTGILLFILLGLWQNCQAVDLLLKYPVVGGQSLENTSSLPQLINYIYKFALLACGITALVAIIIGAFQYVTSAGDSSKATDAKNRITSALLGILILLGSVLILSTINPDLVSLSLNLPKVKPVTIPDGTENYYCHGCCNKILGDNCRGDISQPPWKCLGRLDTKNSIVAQSMCFAAAQQNCGYIAWKANGGNSWARTTPCTP